MDKIETDYLIIGGGIMGLTVARELHARHPNASIVLIEKEDDVARHASGRNSGVLHAGFYYSPNSLKAKFCREGNAAMREFVAEHGLRINKCGKVVVARNAKELTLLENLYKRGQDNKVDLEWISETQLHDIEPAAKTFRHAIFSPTTAIVNPVEVCRAMRDELKEKKVQISTGISYESRARNHTIAAGGKHFTAGHIINCAGGFAVRIARDFGFSEKYSIVPFKGLYLQYTGEDKPFKRCIYGVPNPKNPFLGVHTGVTVDGKVKIGPTAIPVLGFENYKGINGIDLKNAVGLAARVARLIWSSSDVRNMAVEEMCKYSSDYMLKQASRMLQGTDDLKKKIVPSNFIKGKPGIRAQLMNDRTGELLQDFVVEGDKNTTHVLNAVSPAFTSSIPFAKWIVENHCT